MIARSVSDASTMVAAKSCCSESSRVPISSLLIPMTPFSGVRISWLMVARNVLLASFADSAASLAIRNSSLTSLSSEMSDSSTTVPPLSVLRMLTWYHLSPAIRCMKWVLPLRNRDSCRSSQPASSAAPGKRSRRAASEAIAGKSVPGGSASLSAPSMISPYRRLATTRRSSASNRAKPSEMLSSASSSRCRAWAIWRMLCSSTSAAVSRNTDSARISREISSWPDGAGRSTFRSPSASASAALLKALNRAPSRRLT